MGPLTFGKREEQIFLGREISKTQDYSEETAVRIDQETKRFIMDNYARAQQTLTQYKPVLLKIADELLAREVLDADQVMRLANGQPLEEHHPAAHVGEPASPRTTPERPTLVPNMGKTVAQE